jgi:hypothetical protein
MAIFRAETKHISRGKGHNVVAAAAYRAAEKLTDTNKLNPNATTHDYTNKKGVVAKDIVLPTSLSSKGFSINRQELWSSVEQSETTTRSVKGSRLKQSARLAREWLLALPSELSDDENKELTREFTTKLVNDLGVIADYAIHKPTPFDIKPKKFVGDDEKRVPVAPDERNVHAHIMFTTRKVSADRNGVLVFGDKADSERSELWRQQQGLCNGGDYIKEIRQLWETMLNKRLEQKKILPVTAKSYEDLGLNIVPQHKQGKDATVMSRYHFKPPIVGFNNDIKQHNTIIIKSAADSYIAESVRRIELSDISYDRVTALHRTQATTRDTASERVRDTTSSSTTNERIRDSERVIEEQARRIKHSNIVYDRVADFQSARTGTSDRASERTRERERLIAQSARERSFYSVSIAKATDCHERNIRIIASRLIFRHRDRAKYDDRQMQKLDTFYKTLAIRDFAVTGNLSREEYVQPNEWVGLVRERLTDDKIINNTEIMAIVRDPAMEKSNYLAKTSQNASDSVEMEKTQNSSLESSKALESAVETYERPINRFRL